MEEALIWQPISPLSQESAYLLMSPTLACRLVGTLAYEGVFEDLSILEGPVEGLVDVDDELSLRKMRQTLVRSRSSSCHGLSHTCFLSVGGSLEPVQ